jgi:hypothetical protein
MFFTIFGNDKFLVIPFFVVVLNLIRSVYGFSTHWAREGVDSHWNTVGILAVLI